MGGPRDTLDMLRALDVEYLVVHGPRSEEYYHDFKNPGRFDSILERVWAENDDVIYRVPGYRAALQWTGTNRVVVLPGAAASAPINYDPGWRAAQDGRPVAVEKNERGFILLAATADGPVEMRRRGTMEQQAMAAVSALAWLLAIGALVRTVAK
jgi:hypothetical protein